MSNLELFIMIIEWLPLEDALNFGKALLIQEQVAVQYSAFEGDVLMYIFGIIVLIAAVVFASSNATFLNNEHAHGFLLWRPERATFCRTRVLSIRRFRS